MEQENKRKVRKEKQTVEIPAFLSDIGSWISCYWLDVLKWTGIVLSIVLSIALVVLFFVCLIGRESDPNFMKPKYKIESIKDWEKLDGEGLITYREIVLMTDLDFAGKEYKSPTVGDAVFNGNGHTIKNVSLDAGEKLLGSRNEIKDINFENVTLESYNKDENISLFYSSPVYKNVSISGEIYAPYSNSVGVFLSNYWISNDRDDEKIKFINCSTNVEIVGGKIAGGFIGWGIGNFEFKNCENNGEISAKNYAGGFIGKVMEYEENKYIYSGSSLSLKKCTNNADISSKQCAGGIAGYSQKTIYVSCENNGTVKGTHNVGGLVGRLSGEIQYAVNNGTIIATEAIDGNPINLGGIVGYETEKSVIVDCTNNGELNNAFHITGGIVGNCYGTVAGCVNKGTINAGTCAGGIVGYVGDIIDVWSIQKITVRIAHCTNEAPVNASAFAGGIVGIVDLNKADKATQDAAWMVTTFVDDFVDLNNKISLIDINIKDYLSGIYEVTNDIFKLLTRATKLDLSYCVSSGDVDADYYAAGLIGIMFASSVESEEMATNSFDASVNCPNVSSDGYNYVDAADISKLK